MTTIESGDYLIFSEGENTKGKKKYGLMKVGEVAGKKLHGYLAKNAHLKGLRTQVEINKKDVVINLGQDPAPMSVAGHDLTKLFKGRTTHDDFGTLYFFTHLEEDEKKKLFDAFTKVHKSLKQQGLDFLVDPSTVLWEIMPYNGEKYAGTYKQSRDLEKVQSVAMIRPAICGVNTDVGTAGMRYVIFHELAHHVDFHYLQRSSDARQLRAEWVRLYKSSIDPEVVTKEQSRAIRDKLFDQEENPSDFKSTLDEDETKQFKLIMSHFRSVYSLSPREVDALWDGGYRDDIKDVWPTRITKKGAAPIISDYASTQVCETFAEALSFYWMKKDLPKKVVKLVEKTLSWVKTQREG